MESRAELTPVGQAAALDRFDGRAFDGANKNSMRDANEFFCYSDNQSYGLPYTKHFLMGDNACGNGQ